MNLVCRIWVGFFGGLVEPRLCVDAAGWLAYIREAWNHQYGRMWQEKGLLKLATGGWSGNEAITHAMKQNYVLWALMWESSHRGGLEVLRMPNILIDETPAK